MARQQQQLVQPERRGLCTTQPVHVDRQERSEHPWPRRRFPALLPAGERHLVGSGPGRILPAPAGFGFNLPPTSPNNLILYAALGTDIVVNNGTLVLNGDPSNGVYRCQNPLSNNPVWYIGNMTVDSESSKEFPTNLATGNPQFQEGTIKISAFINNNPNYNLLPDPTFRRLPSRFMRPSPFPTAIRSRPCCSGEHTVEEHRRRRDLGPDQVALAGPRRLDLPRRPGDLRQHHPHRPERPPGQHRLRRRAGVPEPALPERDRQPQQPGPGDHRRRRHLEGHLRRCQRQRAAHRQSRPGHGRQECCHRQRRRRLGTQYLHLEVDRHQRQSGDDHAQFGCHRPEQSEPGLRRQPGQRHRPVRRQPGLELGRIRRRRHRHHRQE